MQSLLDKVHVSREKLRDVIHIQQLFTLPNFTLKLFRIYGTFTLHEFFLDCDCDLFLLIMDNIGVGDVITVA